MKHLQLILFCLIFNFAKGQTPTEWFPIGAEWYYNISPSKMKNFSQNCIKLTVSNDTNILNRVCKTINFGSCIGDTLLTKAILYQNGDTIFYFNELLNDFFILYNFNANVGDTIWVHKNNFQPNISFLGFREMPKFAYVINKVDSLIVNGTVLKTQKISNINDGGFCYWKMAFNVDTTNVIEKIGSMTYFFGHFCAILVSDIDFVSAFICYNDPIVGEFKNPYVVSEFSCDEVSNATFVHSLKNIIQVYPNPISGNEFYFKEMNTGNIKNIKLISSLGEVYFLNYEDNRVSIPYNLPTSIYSLIVENLNGTFYFQKISKF